MPSITRIFGNLRVILVNFRRYFKEHNPFKCTQINDRYQRFPRPSSPLRMRHHQVYPFQNAFRYDQKGEIRINLALKNPP